MIRLTLVATVAFVGGMAFEHGVSASGTGGATQREDDRPRLYAALDDFAAVYGRIRESYVEPVDGGALVHGAIRGMVAELDPHSEFLTSDAYAQAIDETRGRYGGVGLELAVRRERLVIVAPLDDSPAARAGLRSGDVIVAIEGRSTRDATLGDAARWLRGRPGTPVELTIERRTRPETAADGRRFEITLERALIEIAPVEGRLLDGRIGYVRVKIFQRDTVEALQRQIRALKRRVGSVGGPLAGLVLDLRNNPGGLLSQAVAAADLFLTDGEIVRTVGRGDVVKARWRATRPGTLTEVPMVVLINGGSASASEILAGALQDGRRGLLVGTSTFGKGSVQGLFRFPGGAGLKLTVAHYLTPSGRSIHGQGIEPDIVLAAGAEPPIWTIGGGPGRTETVDPASRPGAGPVDPAIARAASILLND